MCAMITSPATDWDRLRRAQREAIETRARASHRSPQLEYLTHAFFELYAGLPGWERHARTIAYAIEHEPVHLFDDDLLVGTLYQGCAGAAAPTTYPPGVDSPWWPHSVREMAQRLVAERLPDHAALITPEGGGFLMMDGAAPGHIAWQWERLLAEGIDGLLQRCREAEHAATEEQSRQFAAGVRIAGRGAGLERTPRRGAGGEGGRQRGRAADHCRRCWTSAAGCRPNCPHLPEAIQSYHFQHLAVMFENPSAATARAARPWAGPYLERDLAAGIIHLDEARALIEGLLLKFPSDSSRGTAGSRP